MSNRHRFALLLAATPFVAGALAACSGESRPSAALGSAASSSGAGTASASASETVESASTIPFGPDEAGATVAVALKEFAILTPTTEVPAGKVFVTGTNMGEGTHELVITHAGAADEEGAIAEAAEIMPGETEALAVDLTPGRYQFACYVKEDENGTTEDHYALGMVHRFDVK